MLNEKERDYWHTAERLRTHPELSRFVRWLARKPPEFMDRHRPPRRRDR